MKQFIQVFDVELTVKGPVFIGSGQEITKKEYIFDRSRNKILVPELGKMYSDLRSMGKAGEFEKYILNPGKLELVQWLRQQRISDSDFTRWKKYELDSGDAVIERGTRMQIMSCVKDAYGMPYIPGSSLKGMLRTILLAYDIGQNPLNYERVKRSIIEKIDEKQKRTRYLSNETGRLEEVAFHKLKRSEKRYDKTNDLMAGFIVSDSAPLRLDDLVLCQKLEYHTNGTIKRLNLLRECVKPETKVHFTLTVDRHLCQYTKEYIMEAVSWFAEESYEHFIRKYPKMDRPAPNTVWLGGGVGYVSKTIEYELFGKDALQNICIIFRNTNVPREHKHSEDRRLGVSPHILKLTQYQGKQYQFGMCQISI